ncbi:hypothetical protein DFS33DRAFT_643836 [Desarmillaria ectypa]|nr:hypothetical protein DFS33DRAFT_643836 [Desarmillaria ectypa]
MFSWFVILCRLTMYAHVGVPLSFRGQHAIKGIGTSTNTATRSTLNQRAGMLRFPYCDPSAFLGHHQLARSCMRYYGSRFIQMTRNFEFPGRLWSTPSFRSSRSQTSRYSILLEQSSEIEDQERDCQ